MDITPEESVDSIKGCLREMIVARGDFSVNCWSLLLIVGWYVDANIVRYERWRTVGFLAGRYRAVDLFLTNF